MNLEKLIDTAQRCHHMSQRELAEALHLTPQALCHAIKRRRPLPAEAVIYLAELVNQNARIVLEAAERHYKSHGVTGRGTMADGKTPDSEEIAGMSTFSRYQKKRRRRIDHVSQEAPQGVFFIPSS